MDRGRMFSKVVRIQFLCFQFRYDCQSVWSCSRCCVLCCKISYLATSTAVIRSMATVVFTFPLFLSLKLQFPVLFTFCVERGLLSNIDNDIDESVRAFLRRRIFLPRVSKLRFVKVPVWIKEYLLYLEKSCWREGNDDIKNRCWNVKGGVAIMAKEFHCWRMAQRYIKKKKESLQRSILIKIAWKLKKFIRL